MRNIPTAGQKESNCCSSVNNEQNRKTETETTSRHSPSHVLTDKKPSNTGDRQKEQGSLLKEEKMTQGEETFEESGEKQLEEAGCPPSHTRAPGSAHGSSRTPSDSAEI